MFGDEAFLENTTHDEPGNLSKSTCIWLRFVDKPYLHWPYACYHYWLDWLFERYVQCVCDTVVYDVIVPIHLVHSSRSQMVPLSARIAKVKTLYKVWQGVETYAASPVFIYIVVVLFYIFHYWFSSFIYVLFSYIIIYLFCSLVYKQAISQKCMYNIHMIYIYIHIYIHIHMWTLQSRLFWQHVLETK